MKQIFTIFALILFSAIELFPQSKWIDKGEYLEMENTPAGIRHMKLSEDETKLLLICDTDENNDGAVFKEIDVATGEQLFEKPIPYKWDCCVPQLFLPNGRVISRTDSMTISGYDIESELNYFSIKLESVKKFADSLSGYSKITGIYPWYDYEFFCIAVGTKYRSLSQFQYGYTGNYYIIDKYGDIIFRSEEVGYIKNFIPGKDLDNFAISFKNYDYNKTYSRDESPDKVKLFGENELILSNDSKLMTYGKDYDVLVTSTGDELQFWDMTNKIKMKTMPAVAESVYFINQGNHFILHGYAGGFHYTKAVHYGSLKKVDEDIYNDTNIGNASEPVVGTGFVINLRESLFLFRHHFKTDELAANYLPNYHVLEESAVSFINLSYGNPDAWFWNFGDGNTSKEKNPVHVYKEPGAYKVRLTAHEGSEYSYYTSDTLVTVHKILQPKISVSPLSGRPPFEIKIENLSEITDRSYITVGSGGKYYSEKQVVDTITGSGDICVWLTLYDSVFQFVDYKIVKSEYTELESDIFTLDRVFAEESVSSTIDTIVLGNYDNLIFSCRHDEYDDKFEIIRTYYTINSIDKNFNDFRIIKTFEEEIDLIKLLNGNYLILFKEEGRSTLEIDEEGNEISRDKFVINNNRKIKSIKQGEHGNVFTETSVGLITCFDRQGKKLWEKRTNIFVSYLPLRDGGVAIGRDIQIYHYYGYGIYVPYYKGSVDIYNNDGKWVSSIGLKSGTDWAYCRPILLYESDDKTYFSYKHNGAGNYMGRDYSFVNLKYGDQSHFNQYFFLSDELLVGIDSKVSFIDLTSGLLYAGNKGRMSVKSVTNDGEYAFFAGHRLPSSLPYLSTKNIRYKTDAYLAKTKRLSQLTSIKEEQVRPIFGLQIFPNPASDKLKVSINLNSAEWVNLEILDINGNHINSVFQGYMSPGQQEISADLSDYPVGAYIIRLIAGRNVYSGKLIVKR